MRLAGQHVTRIELAPLQAVVFVHSYAALQHLRPAGAAHAAFAGEGQIDSGRERSIQDRRIAVAKLDLAPDAVTDDRDDRLRSVLRFRVMRSVGVRHSEALDVNVLWGNT